MTNQLQHQQRRAVDLRIPAIEKYAYCLCLHVKPTTIFIAVFKLMRSLLFASILLNTEFSDDPIAYDDRHKSTVAAVNILTRIIMASVSAVGIYAVLSGRAALLMPLYAILLVDFFFALPAFYNRDPDPTFGDTLADIRNYSTGNTHYTRYSLMLVSTITMIVKIYFLCVIWKCYRYLRLVELVSPIRLSEIYPHIHQGGPQYPIVRVLGSGDSADLSNGHSMAPPPYESIASNMKPPNYEEAMKSSSSMNFPVATTDHVTLRHQQTVVYPSINATTPNTTEPTQQNIPTPQINSDNSLHQIRPRTENYPIQANVCSVPQCQSENIAEIPVLVENSHPNTTITINNNNNNSNTSNDNTPTAENLQPTNVAAATVNIPHVENNQTRDTS